MKARLRNIVWISAFAGLLLVFGCDKEEGRLQEANKQPIGRAPAKDAAKTADAEEIPQDIEIPHNITAKVSLPKGIYRVTQLVIIHENAVLKLAPGVKVLFGSTGGIVSYGTLEAVGTPAEPISFSAADQEKRWRSISIVGKGSKKSVMDNCEVSGGGGVPDEFIQVLLTGRNDSYIDASYGGGVYLHESDATINNCKIVRNECTGEGGGLYLYKSNPILANLQVQNNGSFLGGGGISMHSSNPSITDSRIEGNTADRSGGGIAAHESNPIISKCTIRDNDTNSAGGGLFVQESKLVLSESTIAGNHAGGGTGGGASIGESEVNITKCIIKGNKAARYGAALFLDSSPCQIDDSVIEGNEPKWAAGIGFIKSRPELHNTSPEGGVSEYITVRIH